LPGPDGHRLGDEKNRLKVLSKCPHNVINHGLIGCPNKKILSSVD
jgi:hypothetical protein